MSKPEVGEGNPVERRMGQSAEGAAARSKYIFKAAAAAAAAAAQPILGEKFLLLGLATGQGLETLSRWWPLSPRDFSERQRARERVPLGD